MTRFNDLVPWYGYLLEQTQKRRGYWILADTVIRWRQRGKGQERNGRNVSRSPPQPSISSMRSRETHPVPPQYPAWAVLSTLNGHFVSQRGMLTSKRNLTRGNTQGFPWDLSALWLLHKALGVALWLAWQSDFPWPPVDPSRAAPSCCRLLRLYIHFYYCYKTKRNKENPNSSPKILQKPNIRKFGN